jgi:cell division protein FtsW
VLVLFAIIAYVIWQIASKADTDFVRLATVGIGIWIVAQAFLNVGAVLGALPITGLPLPLVSYGGSSLTFTLMAIGMLLAFARSQPAAKEFLQTRKAAKRHGKSRSSRLSARSRRRYGRAGRRASKDSQPGSMEADAQAPSRRRSSKAGKDRKKPTRGFRRRRQSDAAIAQEG